jgi:hypothetical protein
MPLSPEEKKEITEQEYLDMADHCKKLVEQKNNQMEKLTDQIDELKKILMVSYGFVRVIDYYNEDQLATECKDVLEMLRGYLSSMLEEYIL